MSERIENAKLVHTKSERGRVRSERRAALPLPCPWIYSLANQSQRQGQRHETTMSETFASVNVSNHAKVTRKGSRVILDGKRGYANILEGTRCVRH